jgi:hypothetical protein
MIMPKPLMVVGSGVSAYDSGEIWHLIDQRLEIPVVRVTQQQLNRLALHHYTHIILSTGRYSFDEKINEKLATWINRGGQLIANRTAGNWLVKQDWSPIKKVDFEEENIDDMPYAERSKYLAEKYIGGAIYQVGLDTSHPLAFGINTKTIPIFRRGTDVYQVENNPFVTIARYTDKPLLSGFSSDDNQKKIANSVSIAATRKGKGSVIFYSDNMNFRAFWWGSSKLFSNSFYFGKAFQSSAGE